MCRLLIMSGITNTENAVKFMQEAKHPMSVGNNMGIGFSATKGNGDFFSERWHKNDQFFNREVTLTEDIIEKLKPFQKRLPNLDVNYSSNGEIEFSDIKSMTLHTRYATCGREFINTHPFVDGDFSLVHNGVISNARQLKLNKISTCDSEVALQAYKDLGVNLDPSKAQAWIDMLEGYWAFGIFSRDASGKRILDIVRNDATLYATTVEGLGIVLATTPHIITETAEKLGLETTGRPSLMTSNVMFRLDATTGNVLEKFELEDSVLNRTKSSWSYGADYTNITGKQAPVVSERKVLKMPESKKKEVKEPEINMEDNGLDFYEDEFQQFDDAGIPMEDRIMMYDDMFDDDIMQKLYRLPPAMVPDYTDNTDFYDVVEAIEEAYDFYTGQKYFQN